MELKYKAILDPDFMPMELVMRDYEKRVAAGESQRLIIAVERNEGCCERFAFDILKDGANDALNCDILERFIKTLLWVYGGWKIYVHGSKVIYDYLKSAYADGGLRAFDA